MARGRLGYEKWFVGHIGGKGYLAGRIISGKKETWEREAHCLQCAKVDLLTERGGRVDLRGWHRSKCGRFLRAMQIVIDNEKRQRQ